jgi:polysaccharide biosynthesis/export protein
MRAFICAIIAAAACAAAPAVSAAATVPTVQTVPPGQPVSTGQTGGPVQPMDLAVDTTAPRSDAAIAPLDHLDVTVFREPDLSAADVTVDESGHVALPLVGGIVAAGKSTDALSAEIAGKLREYVRNPQVAVTMKQAASRRVTVTGSVVQPGVYPIDGRLTLLQAVALAKGPSEVASMKQAFIFRTRNGQRAAARFDLDAIAKGKANDPEVISGDTVTLGSSGIKTAWRDILHAVSSFSIWRILP